LFSQIFKNYQRASPIFFATTNEWSPFSFLSFGLETLFSAAAFPGVRVLSLLFCHFHNNPIEKPENPADDALHASLVFELTNWLAQYLIKAQPVCSDQKTKKTSKPRICQSGKNQVGMLGIQITQSHWHAVESACQIPKIQIPGRNTGFDLRIEEEAHRRYANASSDAYFSGPFIVLKMCATLTPKVSSPATLSQHF